MDQCVRQRLGAVASDSCQYPVVRGSAQRHRLQARDFQRDYGDGGAKRSTADSTRHATQQVAAPPLCGVCIRARAHRANAVLAAMMRGRLGAG